MKDKKLHDILKAADDGTLRRLSRAAPLSEYDKERIFSESMRKLREKQNGSSPRIVMNKGGYSKSDTDKENNTTISQLRTGVSKTVISAAAALVLVLGLSGIFLLNNNRLSSSYPPAAASSENSAAAVLTTSPEEVRETLSSEENAVTTVTAEIPDKTPSEGTGDSSSAPDDTGADSSEAASDSSRASSSQTSSAESIPETDYALVTADLVNVLSEFISFTNGVTIECDESVAYIYDGEVMCAYDPDDMPEDDSYSAADEFVKVTDERYHTPEDMRAPFRSAFTDSLLTYYIRDYGDTPFCLEVGGELYMSRASFLSRYDPLVLSYATDINIVSADSFTFRVGFEGGSMYGICTAVLENGAWKISDYTLY